MTHYRDFRFSVPTGTTKQKQNCSELGIPHWFAKNKMARDRCVQCGGKRCETCGGGGQVPADLGMGETEWLNCPDCQAAGTIPEEKVNG